MKQKTLKLLFCVAFISSTNFVLANEVFILPSMEEFQLMTDGEKLSLFTDYDNLSLEDKTIVQEEIGNLPEDYSYIINYEYQRVIQDNIQAEQREMEEKLQAEIEESTPKYEKQGTEEESAYGYGILIAALGVFFILIILVVIINSRKKSIEDIGEEAVNENNNN